MILSEMDNYPIIAHAERYQAVTQRRCEVSGTASGGRRYIQLNADSITGAEGFLQRDSAKR